MATPRLNQKIEELENEGVRLGYEVKQLLHTKDPDTKLFDSYTLWKIKLLHLAEACRDRDFAVAVKKADGVTSGIFTTTAFSKDKVAPPVGAIRFLLTDKKETRYVMDKESISQIRSMEIGIENKLKALSDLRSRLLNEPSKVVGIRIEVKDRIIRRVVPNAEDIVSDFKRGNRFEMILKIARSAKPIAAKKFGRNIQAISTKVRLVNKKAQDDLKLNPKKKFIINPDERSGYQINDAYDILEIK